MGLRNKIDMTNLTLKNARIVSEEGGTEDGIFCITIECKLRDVSGTKVESHNLDVEIKNEI